jgi:hypothetical protein
MRLHVDKLLAEIVTDEILQLVRFDTAKLIILMFDAVIDDAMFDRYDSRFKPFTIIPFPFNEILQYDDKNRLPLDDDMYDSVFPT